MSFISTAESRVTDIKKCYESINSAYLNCCWSMGRDKAHSTEYLKSKFSSGLAGCVDTPPLESQISHFYIPPGQETSLIPSSSTHRGPDIDITYPNSKDSRLWQIIPCDFSH